MVGYCIKEIGKEHFEFVHHNILTYDMKDDKLEHMKFRKVGVKNQASLLHSNILQRAHQWARFCTKKHLGAILPSTLFVACARVANSTRIRLKSSHRGLRV